MPLKHTPACTTYHPDRFEDEETCQTYSVCKDIDAQDPRTLVEDEQVAVYTYRGPRGHADLVPDNAAARAFDRFWDSHDADKALALTRRYLAIFHPDQKISIGIETVRGYAQGDWGDVFAAVADGYGTPEDHIRQFRRWAFGDVWTIIPDGGAGISGIYADSPEEAVEMFRQNYEDVPVQHNTGTAVTEKGEEPPEPQVLDVHAPGEGSHLVRWEIDSNDSISPAQAAATAWQQSFHRGLNQPGPDDACVFVVVNAAGQSVEIDLSDEQFAYLFI